MVQYQHDPEDPEADLLVLRRIGEASEIAGVIPVETADYQRLRTEIVGQVVSTGDRFAGFEIIEIVPPDEPALVRAETVLEIV